MSFKRFFPVIALAVTLIISTGGQASAEEGTAEQDEAHSFSTDLSLVQSSYDEESMIYYYAFPDGAAFYSSQKLTEGDNYSDVFLVGTEEDDISILVYGGGTFLEQSREYFLTDKQTYEVTVSHTVREGGGSVQARFSAVVGEEPEGSAETVSITGRVELEAADGDNFRHHFMDGSELITNVLDGETVSFMPKLSIPEDIICTMKRDGNLVSVPSSGLITEDGAYCLEFTCYNGDNAIEKRTLSFSVFSVPTNRLGIYQPPYGFELSSVSLNGEAVPVADRNYILLNGEGEYNIEYENGSVVRSASLVRDTVPPVLYFNDTTDIVFTEKVIISADTPCTYRVLKNGQVLGNITELMGSGVYRVVATDDAGNETSARVEIKAVSAINPLDIVIICGALAIAAGIYFFVQKNKRMRVR